MPTPWGTVPADFPYHAIPDGNSALAHHYYTGILLAFVFLLVVWDDYPDREPLASMLAVVVGVFAFAAVWPRYPVVGAVLAVAAPVVVAVEMGARLVLHSKPAEYLPIGSNLYPWFWLALALLFAVVALDDALQHAFGWPTPLDEWWKHGGRASLPST